MRRRTPWYLAALAVFALIAGCSVDDQTDSETHWQRSLQACDQDSDCGSMLSCLCGMCTTTCQSDPSVCGNLSGNASCALESGTVFQLCGGDASVPDSICANDCASETDCPDGHSCVSGYCSPRDSTVDPDGGDGSDSSGDVPTDAPDDRIPEEYRCGEPGNPDCCKADFYPDSRDVRQIPAFAGEYESSTFELPPGASPAQLTFEGVVDADIRDVPCPPNATDRGVFCQVDYAMSFEGGDVAIFLGLPRSTLESLASPGDTLTLAGTMFDGDVTNLLLTAADGSVLLDLGLVTETRTPVNDEVFEADRDDYRLFMQEPGDDFSQAECLEGPDECDRMYAVLPLTLEYGNQTEELNVDTTFDFSSNGTDYTLRYFVSYERIGLPMSCADVTPARMNYLVVPDGP